jgi:hypothetical protein
LSNGAARYPMIRRFFLDPLPATNLAQHFCALSNPGKGVEARTDFAVSPSPSGC